MGLRGRGIARRKFYSHVGLLEDNELNWSLPPLNNLENRKIELKYLPLLHNNPKTLKKRLEITKGIIKTQIQQQRRSKQQILSLIAKQRKHEADRAVLKGLYADYEDAIRQLRRIQQCLEAQIKKDQDARKRQGLEAFPTGETQEESPPKNP